MKPDVPEGEGAALAEKRGKSRTIKRPQRGVFSASLGCLLMPPNAAGDSLCSGGSTTQSDQGGKEGEKPEEKTKSVRQRQKAPGGPTKKGGEKDGWRGKLK